MADDLNRLQAPCPASTALQHGWPLVEVCVDGTDGVLAAQAGGADRAELCASLIEGGITPSLGTVRETVRAARIPAVVMLRPRGGDFLYSDSEFAGILADAALFATERVGGIVTGCLRPDGTVDEARMTALVQRCGTVPVACHRAFDMTPDPFAALDALVRCGIARVLTSGQRPRATDALPLLRDLVQAAGDRIAILGCGGLGPDNIAAVHRATGLREVHFSAPVQADSAMVYRNPAVGMGGTSIDREYTHTLTGPDRVRATITALRGTALRPQVTA